MSSKYACAARTDRLRYSFWIWIISSTQLPVENISLVNEIRFAKGSDGAWSGPLSGVLPDVFVTRFSVVQNDTQERSVDVKPAVVLDES